MDDGFAATRPDEVATLVRVTYARWTAEGAPARVDLRIVEPLALRGKGLPPLLVGARATDWWSSDAVGSRAWRFEWPKATLDRYRDHPGVECPEWLGAGRDSVHAFVEDLREWRADGGHWAAWRVDEVARLLAYAGGESPPRGGCLQGLARRWMHAHAPQALHGNIPPRMIDWSRALGVGGEIIHASMYEVECKATPLCARGVSVLIDLRDKKTGQRAIRSNVESAGIRYVKDATVPQIERWLDVGRNVAILGSIPLSLAHRERIPA